MSGTLAPDPGIDPIAFTRVTDRRRRHTVDENDSIKKRVMPKSVADTAKSLLTAVVSAGTGTNAAGVSDYEWGKTGTTENNGDAWFCGATESATTCVWVGHADSMTTDGDRVRRLAGRRRNDPGVDLVRRDDRLGADPGRARSAKKNGGTSGRPTSRPPPRAPRLLDLLRPGTLAPAAAAAAAVAVAAAAAPATRRRRHPHRRPPPRRPAAAAVATGAGGVAPG